MVAGDAARKMFPYVVKGVTGNREAQLVCLCPSTLERFDDAEGMVLVLGWVLIVEQQSVFVVVTLEEDDKLRHERVDDSKHIVGTVLTLEVHRENINLHDVLATGDVDRSLAQFIEPCQRGDVVNEMLPLLGTQIPMLVEGFLRDAAVDKCRWREM